MKALLYVIFILSLTACKYKPGAGTDEHLVVCTTTIIADAIREIAGPECRVKTLMGAGVDPHMYEPRPSDVRALGEARVIICNGLHLEGKMSDLFHKLKHEKEVIAFSDGMPESSLIALNEHTYDPHVWFDTRLWLDGIAHAVDRLCVVYPQYADRFRKRFASLEKRYRALIVELRAELQQVDPGKRVLITSHDAFHYFGKAYDVEVMGLQGISTVSEPGIRDVSELINTIISRNIRAVFIESSVSPRAIRSVMESCRSRGYALKIGNMLYSDALGDEHSGAGTYEEMMRKNVRSIVNGLR